MEDKTSSAGPKESKISQNLLIAIIGAVTTIVAAVIPFVLSRNNTSPSPSPIPIIITAVVTATPAPFLPTETAVVPPTEVSFTFTPTLESPTATATATEAAQEGIFNGFLASDIKGVFATNKYKPDQIIYLFFDINDPANKNVLRIVWSVVDVKGFLPGSVRYDITDVATVKKYKTLSNHSTNPWPAGKYKVDLYLNDILQQTIDFEIIP